MPDDQSKLTPEQQRLAQKWFDTKLANKMPTCPLCQTNVWDVLEHFLELRPYGGGGIVVGVPVYPNIALVCKHCGYTALVNAIAAGILPSVVEKQEGGSDAK